MISPYQSPFGSVTGGDPTARGSNDPAPAYPPNGDPTAGLGSNDAAPHVPTGASNDPCEIFWGAASANPNAAPEPDVLHENVLHEHDASPVPDGTGLHGYDRGEPQTSTVDDATVEERAAPWSAPLSGTTVDREELHPSPGEPRT